MAPGCAPPAEMTPAAAAPDTPEGPVTMTYKLDARTTVTESFDYLIVACDPRSINIVQDNRTPLEKKVNDALTSFTFHTSLFKANRPGEDPAKGPNYAVRFNPDVLGGMKGEPYGFRDEVFAHDPNLKPDATGKTYCTTYQLDGNPLYTRDRNTVRKNLDKKRDAALNGVGGKKDYWVDWSKDEEEHAQPEENVLVDYFPHFSGSDLQKELPWKIKNSQGEKNTLYVSSFTCFESVLHCYLYGEQLMDPEGELMKDGGKFPKDTSKKFAVIGAGPSGLLFASQHLKKKGYNNFKVFEQSARFGGKTWTFHRKAPGSGIDVPCELGTCYLSPAYDPMLWMFKEYDAGEVVALDRGSAHFRSIVDPELPRQTAEEKRDGVEYGAWTVRKNMAKYNTDFKVEQMKMVFQTVMYIAVHYAIMGIGINDAMPANPPTKDSVTENMMKIIEGAKRRERDMERDLRHLGEEMVDVLALFSELREWDKEAMKKEAEKKETIKAKNPRATPQDPRGFFHPLDDIVHLVEDLVESVVSAGNSTFAILDHFSTSVLREASSEVFELSYGAFLDKHGMGSLKSIFVYGYQVQGYGTIDLIPCYYGFIWITPATMMQKIKWQFDPPKKDSEEAKRGTVNIATKGWLTLWEKIVERDLKDKIVYNVDITSITRCD